MPSTRKVTAKKLSLAGNVREFDLKPSAEQRWKMIAEAAFFKAELRNFTPGHEDLDWFEAEKEIEILLANQ